MEPRGVKVQPQGHKKCRKSTTCGPRVPKRSPGCYNGAPRSPQMQNTHKMLTQLAKKSYQKVPQVTKQRRKTIYPQTTNQPKKQKGKQRNKQSNKHTHAQELRTANTNTNSRGRVLAEGDVDPPRCVQHPLPACWTASSKNLD